MQVTELVLDKCAPASASASSAFDGLTDEFTHLEVLSLVDCGITSLKGFPKLPQLRKVLSRSLTLPLTLPCPSSLSVLPVAVSLSHYQPSTLSLSALSASAFTSTSLPGPFLFYT